MAEVVQGWDAANNRYRDIAVDALGRLMTSDSAAGVSNATLSQVTVTTTATRLSSASPSASRSSVKISVPGGGQTVFVGTSNAVTAANGYPVAAGSSESYPVGPGVTLWGIVAAGTQVTNVAEYG